MIPNESVLTLVEYKFDKKREVVLNELVTKRKQKKQKILRREVWFVLLVVGLIWGVGKLTLSNRVLGVTTNSSWGNNQNQNEDGIHTPTVQQPGRIGNGGQRNQQNNNIVNAAPTLEVTLPIQPTDTPTEAPTAAPTIEPAASPTPTPTAQPAPVMIQPVMSTTSITERSVVNLPSISNPPSGNTGMSIFQSIKNKIESIGGGTPKPTPTPWVISEPTPTETPAKISQPDILLPTDLELKYQMYGSQLSLIADTSAGKQVVVDQNQLKRLESSSLAKLERTGVTLNLTNDNLLAISKGKVTVVTSLPISIDVSTDLLKATTGQGDKEISILPDKALQNILDLGAIGEVNPKEIPQLIFNGKELAYEFGGTRTYKTLGLFNVSVPVTIFVSAETGEIVSGDQPLLTNFVRLISI